MEKTTVRKINLKAWLKSIKDGSLLVLLITLLAFSMSFYRIILPYFIWLIGLSWLFTNGFWDRFKQLWKNKYFLIIVAFYLYHVLGLIYTNNMKDGLFNIEVKLSLFIFPMVFFSSENIIIKKKNTILNAFVWGIVVSVVFCYFNALYQAHIHAKGDNFFNFDVLDLYHDKSFFQLILTGNSYLNYGWFSAFIHVNYFAMYITFALYIAYQRILSKKYNNVLYYILLIFLLMTMALIQSRASLVALFILVMFESVKYLMDPGKRFLKFFVVSVIFMAIILFVINSGRFKQVISNPEQISIEQLKTNNVRLQVWIKSIQIIQENLIFGVGTGDADDMLKKHYTQELFDASLHIYLNVHNEFIETTLRLGLVGLFLLLTLILFPLFIRKKDKTDYALIIAFVILIATEFMFESMMVRLNGVIFFAFFYALLNIGTSNSHNEDLKTYSE